MRKRNLGLIVTLTVIALVIAYALPAAADLQSTSGFEAADADMTPNAGTPNFDWNSFGPLCSSTNSGTGSFCFGKTADWHGTAPYRTTTDNSTTPPSNLVKSGWTVIGFEDAQNSATDSGFGGGTKEDDECPAVNPGNAPNKDDMKSIYMASKVVSGDPYLMLAWTRIPLNTTQSSTHLAFEFNQNQGFSSSSANYSPCGAGSDGLVHRKAGDFLILYDFGGSNTFPTIGIQFWVAKGGTCATANHTGKQACWGTETTLTTSSNTAVAAVDQGVVTDKQGHTLATFPTSTLDCLSPVNNCTTPTAGSAGALGLMEFGEAGVNLRLAGVFTAGQCETFGTTSAVSRTSGDSGNSAMEDLVGPGNLNLTNCGEVKIIKHTDPRGIDQDFTYGTTIPSSATFSKTPDATSPVAFTLNDTGNTTADSAGNTEDITNVPAGDYTVSETNIPAAYSLESLTCTNTGSGETGVQHAALSPQADIHVVGGGLTVCTYVNQQEIGAIRIIKTGKYVPCASPSPSTSPSPIPSPYSSLGVCSNTKTAQLKGAHFKIQLKTGSSYSDVTGATDLVTGSDGTVCFSSADILNGNTYGVIETQAPPGYANDAGSAITDVTITDTGSCSTGKQKAVTFTDTPKTDLTVTAQPEAGNATNSTISCGPSPAPTTTAGPTPRPTYSATGLTPSPSPSAYTCTILVDP